MCTFLLCLNCITLLFVCLRGENKDSYIKSHLGFESFAATRTICKVLASACPCEKIAMFTSVYSFQTFNLCTFCVYLLRNNRQPILYQRFNKNSAYKARHSNFKMLDKVNDDLYKRCLLLYFM